MEESLKFSRPNLLQKFCYCLFAFSGLPYILVLAAFAFVNVNKPDNTKEIQFLTSVITIGYLTTPILVVLALIAWFIYDKKRKNLAASNKLIRYCILSCRCFLSGILLYYGLSKWVGDGQFHLGYQFYGNELGSMPGGLLAWAFFGYSKFYSYSIGLAEIAGGLLLLYRRTALLGAIFLLPVLINIALVDYSFDVSAKDIIAVLLSMDIFLVAISIRPLITFFVKSKPVEPQLFTNLYDNALQQNKKLQPLLFLIVIFFAILANYRQFDTPKATPLQGAWQATIVKNFSDNIPEKNGKLNLKLLIDANVALIKKTSLNDYFEVKLDNSNKGYLTLTNFSDTFKKTRIVGSYKLINKDSMIFKGKDGADSVQWSFKKYERNN